MRAPWKNLHVERWYPLVLALIAKTAYIFFMSFHPSNIHLILSMALAIIVILVDQILVKPVFYKAYKKRDGQHDIMSQLKRSGYIKDLNRFIKELLLSSMFLALSSYLGTGMDGTSLLFSSFWVFSLIYFNCALIRYIIMVYLVLNRAKIS